MNCFSVNLILTRERRVNIKCLIGYTVGCFIFSPFLNFKMPGVPIGGISGKKFAPQFFFQL